MSAVKCLLGAIAISVSLAGCASLRTDGGPPALVDSDQLALAIFAYVEATRQLAEDGGFDSATLETKPKVVSAGSNFLGLSSSGGSAADVSVNIKTPLSEGFARPVFIDSISNSGQIPATNHVEYFLRTGTAAATMLCQEYVAGLADKQDLLSYLKKQFGFAGTLTSTAFAIYNASSISKSVLEASTSFVNSSFDNYSDYRFLSPSDESVLDVALLAQHSLFVAYTTAGGASGQDVRPKTFAEALAAMHNIEHQCTHAGLKALINKSVQNVKLKVDEDGQVTTNNN